MSFAVTSSIVWWTRRPAIAANIPLIIFGTLPFLPRLPRMRSGLARCVGWLCEDGGVDVREHLIAQVLAVDGGDDRPVLRGDEERRLIGQDERGARALRGRPVDAGADAGLVDGDAALADALEGMAAELERLAGLDALGQQIAERRPRGLRRGCGGSVGARPGDRLDGIDDHDALPVGASGPTVVTSVGATESLPTLIVIWPFVTETDSAVPFAVVPSDFV